MPPTNNWRKHALTLPLLMLLLAGCQPALLPLLPKPVPPPRIPPLSAQARQPLIRSECLPSCSAGLTRLRESSLGSPTNEVPPGQLVKPNIKP